MLHASEFESLGNLQDLIFAIHLVLDDELCFILRWTNTAPLPCCGCASMCGRSVPCGNCAPSFLSLGSCTSLGSCSRTCVTCSSALCSTLVCAVFRLVELLGPPTASLAYQARVYCGCKPGPTRVLPMPRQYGIGRRAPALRTLATSYDFKETWFIDVSSCNTPFFWTHHFFFFGHTIFFLEHTIFFF